MTKGSKRQSKKASKQDTSRKSIHHQPVALDLLSEELQEQLESTAGELLVLPSKRDAAKARAAADAAAPPDVPPERLLSRSEQRKLKQVEAKKARRDGLAGVLSQLASTQASDEILALMRPLHQKGARETKKQQLRRELKMQRAGLELGDASELLKERRPRGGGGGGGGGAKMDVGSDGSDDDSDSCSGSDGGAAAAAGAGARKAGAAAAAASVSAAAGEGSGDDSSGDEMEGVSGASGGALDEEAVAVEDPGVASERRRAAMSAAREEARRVRQEAGIEDEDDGRTSKLPALGPNARPTAGGRHRAVTFTRTAAIEEVRSGLPIVGMEQEVMEKIGENDVVVLCGETGCGKTTQVPQFLLEAGYGNAAFPERAGAVGVTQPRRVAAVSTATRVADELGSPLGGLVGYQIRHDKAVGKGTALKFMTDGILLRELQEDFLLRKYSALVIDEAHERSLNTDLLIGMLSRIVPLRARMAAEARASTSFNPASPSAVHPLKLVIMSATLRTSDFTGNARLFPSPPPIVTVPARQYPVTVHFSRRTEELDYANAAFSKVCRIHRELPPGSILVFVTGQREVEFLCAKLRAKFAPPRVRRGGGGSGAGGDAAAGAAVDAAAKAASGAGGTGEGTDKDADDAFDFEGGDRAEAAASRSDALLDLDEQEEDDYDAENNSADEDEEELVVLGGDCMTPEEIAAAEAKFEEQFKLAPVPCQGGGADGAPPAAAGAPGAEGAAAAPAGPAPVQVLPLYAMLHGDEQARVFATPPPGVRTIIVATNVAETSLTIPGVRYVVDAGRSKQKLLEGDGGLARYEVRWVSKASASQRAGRAGRTGPGHAYRLYSSSHFNDTFPEHTPPEITNTPLEGVVLSMKAMGVDKVQNFPFPTPPEAGALKAAHACLRALCALHPESGALTALGRAMAGLPIPPRHARMLLEVAAWQQAQDQEAATPSSSTAGRALPYAVALAAALSSESPFVHLDAPKAAAGQGNRDGGAGDGGDEDGNDRKERKADEKVEAVETAEAAKKRQSAHHAHARLRHADGDALSALRALCEFEAAGESDVWARDNFLHGRNLREMADLHRQLARCLATAQTSPLFAAAAIDDAPSSSGSGGTPRAADLAALLAAAAGGRTGHGAPLLAAVAASPALPGRVAVALRRALAAGWADQVARRMRSAEHVTKQQEQDAARGGRQAVRYAPSGHATEEDVFLHPRSALHKASPQYVVYTQLVRTVKRPYMAGVTGIDASWLAASGTPLAVLSAPLDEPPPSYRPDDDAVHAWHDVAFAVPGWPLPRTSRLHADRDTRAAVFAAALLDGRAVPAFAEITPLLSVSPGTAARPEMRGVARVGELVGALSRARIDSAASLLSAWASDSRLLLTEVSMWVPKAQHGRLAKLWPRVVGAALEAGAGAGAAKGGGGGDAGGKKKKKRKAADA